LAWKALYDQVVGRASKAFIFVLGSMSAISYVVAGTFKVGPRGHKHAYELLFPAIVWLLLFFGTLAAMALRVVHRGVVAHYVHATTTAAQVVGATIQAAPPTVAHRTSRPLRLK